MQVMLKSWGGTLEKQNKALYFHDWQAPPFYPLGFFIYLGVDGFEQGLPILAGEKKHIQPSFAGQRTPQSWIFWVKYCTSKISMSCYSYFKKKFQMKKQVDLTLGLDMLGSLCDWVEANDSLEGVLHPCCWTFLKQTFAINLVCKAWSSVVYNVNGRDKGSEKWNILGFLKAPEQTTPQVLVFQDTHIHFQHRFYK